MTLAQAAEDQLTAALLRRLADRGQPVAGIVTEALSMRVRATVDAAVELSNRYAPDAPRAVMLEAVVRYAGYLLDAGTGAIGSESGSMSGGHKSGAGSSNDSGSWSREDISHADAWRRSGAAGLLTRWKRRRAGAI